MKTELIDYRENGNDLEAFVAYPPKDKLPLVLLCHAWRGKDDFICQKAIEVAQWGHAGFALDMYGKGILGRSKEENAALKRPFVENRDWLQKRALKAFEVACELPYVDVEKIAVLGFGFGGLCALDLARSGVNLKGAISIYGHFDPAPLPITQPIKAKILILHGYRDSIVTLEELSRFQNELSENQVDWQTHLFGDAMHAFATPTANDPEAGILYNPIAAERAWNQAKQFLQEIFRTQAIGRAKTP